MAGKQILGDDPFGSEADTKDAPPPAVPVGPATAKKAGEVKPAEAKAKPAETKTKPAEAKAKPEAKPEAKPVETKAKPAEAKPVEAKPVEAKAKPAEAKPVEAKPVEAKPVEAKPAEAKPVEAKPVETAPVEATYSTAATEPPSEYGPSIDRPPAARHSGLADEVRHLERRIQERVLPERRGEHGVERQHLPF
jgi:hypothetical protein